MTNVRPPDLPEVDALLAPVDERLERPDDVIAIDAEVEGEVVPGPGGDAREREIVLGRDRGDQRLRPVAPRSHQSVGAAADGVLHERDEVVAQA